MPDWARCAQFLSAPSHAAGAPLFSACVGSTAPPPHVCSEIFPAGSIWLLPPGWVPLMNHSLMVLRVHGPGLPPLYASMVASTNPLGRWKSVTGQPFVNLFMNWCQTWPGPLIENTMALPGAG